MNEKAKKFVRYELGCTISTLRAEIERFQYLVDNSGNSAEAVMYSKQLVELSGAMMEMQQVLGNIIFDLKS